MCPAAIKKKKKKKKAPPPSFFPQRQDAKHVCFLLRLKIGPQKVYVALSVQNFKRWAGWFSSSFFTNHLFLETHKAKTKKKKTGSVVFFFYAPFTFVFFVFC